MSFVIKPLRVSDEWGMNNYQTYTFEGVTFEMEEKEKDICQTCESDEGLCQVCYERKNTVPICNRCGEPIGLTASVVYEEDDSKVYCGPCSAFVWR